jgi:hypothetical protein
MKKRRQTYCKAGMHKNVAYNDKVCREVVDKMIDTIFWNAVGGVFEESCIPPTATVHV